LRWGSRHWETVPAQKFHAIAAGIVRGVFEAICEPVTPEPVPPNQRIEFNPET
jgi:hypothetical protein